MNFETSRTLAERLARVVPGGCHTYSKGLDQYPYESPGVLVRGRGSHVWDADGNEFIEYGMGLRAVTLGHAHPAVVDAVRSSLDFGTNFTRPAVVELECAEKFLGIVEFADMVKFTKDGSSATTAAIKLARAHTGREMVAICSDQPFFSYDDWFMATTTADGGIPEFERTRTVPFAYNDVGGVEALFDRLGSRLAAVILEPARLEPPRDGFLELLRARCTASDTVLVFDEMITGFRLAVAGGQSLYDVRPDLSTWGKAMANGFSLSALAGNRELMELGSRDHPSDNVFLLSTTHGAETCALAAGMATMDVYTREPVVATLYRQGERLAAGIREASERRGTSKHVEPIGFPCALLFSTRDPDGRPSQPYRTLFLQELTRRGVLAPSFIVSYSHTNDDIDRTIEAVDGALEVYARALEDGAEAFLVGAPSRPVFERRFS